MIFKGLSFVRNCLRPENAPLSENKLVRMNSIIELNCLVEYLVRISWLDILCTYWKEWELTVFVSFTHSGFWHLWGSAVNGSFLYHVETFSDIFRGWRNETLTWNGKIKYESKKVLGFRVLILAIVKKIICHGIRNSIWLLNQKYKWIWSFWNLF